MAEKNKSGSEQKGAQNQKPFKDLDTRKEDVNKVKGGRAIREDPCAGGE